MKPTSIVLLGIVALLALATLTFLLQGGEDSGVGALTGVAGAEDAGAAEGAPPGELQSVAEGAEERREAAAETAVEDEESEPAAARSETAPKGPFLRGWVVGTDGLPVSGAEVRVRAAALPDGNIFLSGGPFSGDATSDRDGAFVLSRGKLLGEDVAVEIRARGFLVSKENRAPDTDSGDAGLGTFVLQPGVVLAGEVLDADGNPVASAVVRRTTPGDEGALDGVVAMAAAFGKAADGQTKTDAAGRFELPHEGPGEYALIVEHEAHPRGRFEGTTPPAGREDLDIVLQLAPAATIEGRILGFPAGRRGVVVQAESTSDSDGSDPSPMAILFESAGMGGSHSSRVAADGSFAILGLEVDRTFRVQAFVKEGFFARAPCSDHAQVPSGTSGVELTWDAGASIVFQVQDADTGKPLGGVTVRYLWESKDSEDALEGLKKREFSGSRVELGELRPVPSPRSLELSVDVDGYIAHRVAHVSVAEGERVDLGVVRLKRAPSVRVRVVDAATGDPLKRVRVQLRPERGDLDESSPLPGSAPFAKTDVDGWCELPACSTDTATLVVRKGGYARFEEEGVRMPREAPSEELVRLYAGGKIVVRVVDTAGSPVADAGVSHRQPDGSTEQRKANRRGVLRVIDLEAGEHAFKASRPRGSGGFVVDLGHDDEESEETDWLSTQVVSGRETTLVLELPEDASISGVVLTRGEPVPRARVSLLEGEESSATEELMAELSEQLSALMPASAPATRSDPEGRFRLADVPVGRHRLRVQRAGGAPPHEVVVELRQGENHVEIELPGAAIQGRVIDTQGKPIAGASVRAQRVDPDPDAEDAGDREQMEMAVAFLGGGKSGSIRTDYDGSFLIEGAPHGVPLVVEGSAPGHVVAHSAELTVPENDMVRGVEVVLPAGGSIRVRLPATVPDFQTVTAYFESESAERHTPSMAMARDGEAVLRDLAPGTWRVSLAGGEGEDQRVEVHAGQQAQVTLEP